MQEVILSSDTRRILYDGRVADQVGQGGTKRIYRAYTSEVCVEIPRNPEDSKVTIEQPIRRFLALANCDYSPRAVDIKRTRLPDDTQKVYFVREYIEGVSLSDWLKDNYSETTNYLKMVVAIARDIVKVCEDVNLNGHLHRDIKLENFIGSTDGGVYIIDPDLMEVNAWKERDGVFQLCSEKNDDSSTIQGTVGFMSPERVQGERETTSSEVWSFGACLYQLLNNAVPFEGATQTRTLLNTIYKKTPESKEFIPQNLVNIVTECLRKRSTRRLNWKEIEDKLDEVAASLDEVVEPEVKPTIFEEGLQWIKSHFL
jgi:serine/threonine protein kinase